MGIVGDPAGRHSIRARSYPGVQARLPGGRYGRSEPIPAPGRRADRCDAARPAGSQDRSAPDLVQWSRELRRHDDLLSRRGRGPGQGEKLHGHLDHREGRRPVERCAGWRHRRERPRRQPRRHDGRQADAVEPYVVGWNQCGGGRRARTVRHRQQGLRRQRHARAAAGRAPPPAHQRRSQVHRRAGRHRPHAGSCCSSCAPRMPGAISSSCPGTTSPTSTTRR